MKKIFMRCLIAGSAFALLPVEAFAALPVKLQCDSTGQAVARSAGVPEQMIQRFMVEPAQRGRAYYDSHEITFSADFPYVPGAGTSKSSFQMSSYAWRTMNYFLVTAADALPKTLEGLKRYNQLDAAMQYYNACIDILTDDDRNHADFVRGPAMLDAVEPQLRALVAKARGNRSAEIQILRDYFASTRVRWSAYDSGWPVPYLPEALNGSNLIAAFNQTGSPAKASVGKQTVAASLNAPGANEIASAVARAVVAAENSSNLKINGKDVYSHVGGGEISISVPGVGQYFTRIYSVAPESVQCRPLPQNIYNCEYSVTMVNQAGNGLQGLNVPGLSRLLNAVNPAVTISMTDRFRWTGTQFITQTLIDRIKLAKARPSPQPSRKTAMEENVERIQCEQDQSFNDWLNVPRSRVC
jgi:hypothetical protein